MQGKPPSGQSPQAPQSTPSGMGPKSAQGAQAAGPPVTSGGKMGSAPPAGVDLKRKGRGGEGAKLSDVGWGLIFKLGWKLLGFCKVLAVGYALMMLAQNCMNLGLAQLLGEVTKSLTASAEPGPSNESPATNNAATNNAATTARAPADANPNATTSPAPDGATPPGPPSKERVILVSVLWAILALAVLAIGIPLRMISTKLDMAISNKMRSQLFSRMLRQSPEFYHTHESGELNAVVNQFTVEASMTLRQISIDMLLQVVTLGITVGLIIYNFKMPGGPPVLFGMQIPPAVIPLAVVLFAFISPWMTGKLANRVRDVSRGLQDRMVALNSLVTGAMQSPEEIQAMEAEPMFVKKHDKQLDALMDAKVKNTLTIEFTGLVNGLPGWVVQVVMLAFAVYVALNSGDPKSAGNVVAIFGLTPALMTPIQALSIYLIMAGGAWPRIETVNEMMESRARREEKSGTVKVPSVEPTLVARNVTFAYTPAGRKIFDDISFEIPQGKITGFVARMGQGKTTFFKLALRFYDPQQGQILLGGRPVGEYASDNLYNHIAMMSQFPAFFYDTLRANMQMAKQNATDEEIRAICEKTGVWKILQAGAKDNPLDEEFAAARRLSGGQKKLLALTRCLLRNPSVLFLDEPTVGMDNKEKFSMLEIIKNALKGHTVMVVDHDLRWLVPFCNYFIVLDDGKIAEKGTSEELLAGRGLFYELYHAESAKPESSAQPGPGGPGPQMAQGAGRRPPGA